MTTETLRTISHSERGCFNDYHPVEHLVLGVLARKAARAAATWAR